MNIEETSSDKSPPGIRRISVPGGWLYRVVADTRTVVRWSP